MASPHAAVEDLFFKQGIEAESRPDIAELWSPEVPVKEAGKGRRVVASVAILGVAGVAALASAGMWKAKPAVAVSVAVAPPVPAAPPTATVPVAPPQPEPVAVVAVLPPPAAPKFALLEVPPPAPNPPKAAPPSAPAPSDVPAARVPEAVNVDKEGSCKTAYARHRFSDVINACASAFAARPGRAGLAVMLAHAESERGNAAKAASWAKKAIAIDPAAADAYVFLGSAEQESGHPAQARAAYAKYLKLAPQGRHAADLRVVLASL